VQQRINELNRKHTHQVNGWGYNSQNDLLEKPPYTKKILNGNGVTKVQLLFLWYSVYHYGEVLSLSLSLSLSLFNARLHLWFCSMKLKFVIFILFYTSYRQWDQSLENPCIKVQEPDNIHMLGQWNSSSAECKYSSKFFSQLSLKCCIKFRTWKDCSLLILRLPCWL
jgi:hypothetical protein